VQGSVPGGHFGAALAPAADLDGDGTPELAVAAPKQATPGAQGVVHLLELPTLAAVATLTAGQGQFGAALALGADSDSDGRPELLVGAPISGASGRAQVFDGLESAGPPLLAGSGPLQSGSGLQLQLTQLPPQQLAWLVAGAAEAAQPFKGGTLVPLPQLVLPLPVGGSGTLLLNAAWPDFTPPWTSLWLQAWVPYPAGPQGWIASNALRATGNP